MPDAKLLFIHALTGLHPGSGSALGVVDMPVQRERHTQWPLIPGSSLKGVLRDTCRPGDSHGDEHEAWLAAFGPEANNASDFAGALALTDARLLAFPVRSLHGVFAWATCPAALARAKRDANLLLKNTDTPDIPSSIERGKALCANDSNLVIGEENRLLLEEFEFQCDGADQELVDQWAKRLAQAVQDEATQKRLEDHLVILHDDDFTYFTRHATEVIARVGLDYETKTAKDGALFYEEFLPAETLFYAVVMGSDSRNNNVDRDAAGMLAWLEDKLPQTLQIGGDQTIGKGICAIKISQ